MIKMRILQVSCEGLGKGGVQNIIMNICRNLPHIQFDIVLFTSERRYYDDEFEKLGGTIYRIPKYEGSRKLRRKLDYYIRFFRIFLGTYRILKRNTYDAIHCHNDLESGICNLAAYMAGVKIRISHAHTASNKFSRKNLFAFFYKKALQLLMNCMTNVKIACSEEAFMKLFGSKYLSKSGSFIIPNAIDLKKFIRIKKCNWDDNIKIVHVGRYCDNKNQIMLIELLPYILEEFPNILLQLMGFDEEYKDKLRKKAIKLGVESKVQFLSSESNIVDVLSDANLFIFPSKTEGFGIALLEAQAMEVPCIVSDTVPKIVDCGLCKFLSLKKSKELWANEAINILKNRHNLTLDRDKLDSYDIKNYIEKINMIYKGEIV